MHKNQENSHALFIAEWVEKEAHNSLQIALMKLQVENLTDQMVLTLKGVVDYVQANGALPPIEALVNNYNTPSNFFDY